jgi:radical SAM protein with 4Fe4S-binding SPASM domain
MEQPYTKRLPPSRSRRPDGTIEYRPRCAVWELTLRCDQACRFCGSRAGQPRRDELDTEEALDVIRQLAELGVVEVALHGGEAYLRPDWLTLVRAVTDLGMDATVVTGGRGLSETMAREAKAAGLTAASISLDGTEATHDELRGVTGSHARAMRALGWLKAAGVPVGCNTQLNRQNFRELPALGELLVGLGIYGWQVQLMVPMGRAADSSELWLQPYDQLELMPLVAAERLRCDQHGVRLWPGDNVGYFGPYEHLLRQGRTRQGHSGGCGGGVITIGIESNGDIKACSAMATAGFVAGNSRRTPLGELWEHAPELRLMRDFKLDDLWGYCRECYYAEVCKGGCVWTGSVLMGRWGNNPYCHHRALELLRAGQRERLELARAAPGGVRDTAAFELILEEAPPDWLEQARARVAQPLEVGAATTASGE